MDRILLNYIKLHFLHDVRTPLLAIKVSLNCLYALYQELIDTYKKSRNLGLIEKEIYEDIYLDLSYKSIKNSIDSIQLIENYFNKLKFLVNKDNLGVGVEETISIKKILDSVKIDNKITLCLNEKSIQDFEVNYNHNDLKFCLNTVVEDINECKKEQNAKEIGVDINKFEKTLNFFVENNKSNSNVFNSIEKFLADGNPQRHGLGFYLLKVLLSHGGGRINLIKKENYLLFNIKF